MTPHEQARRIVDYEARRDVNGHIKVYHLPSGDGGGSREVAGINDRYHPEALNQIERLLAEGLYEEAEDVAAAHIEHYTNPVASSPRCWQCDGVDICPVGGEISGYERSSYPTNA